VTSDVDVDDNDTDTDTDTATDTDSDNETMLMNHSSFCDGSENYDEKYVGWEFYVGYEEALNCFLFGDCLSDWN
jgi:hypothetical protein